ncbi:MAG: glycosyltransferase [Mucilaginibacter sp.]|nr:glycosyltransferase [Mucilaginibacter sp.]
MPNNANPSIVVPTHNSETTISHCLRSIINQCIKPGEVIVVDNASTDNTINIVGKYSSLYPLIKWISEPDKGIYDGEFSVEKNASKLYTLIGDEMPFGSHALLKYDPDFFSQLKKVQ